MRIAKTDKTRRGAKHKVRRTRRSTPPFSPLFMGGANTNVNISIEDFVNMMYKQIDDDENNQYVHSEEDLIENLKSVDTSSINKNVYVTSAPKKYNAFYATALTAASATDRPKLLEKILEIPTVDVNYTDNDGSLAANFVNSDLYAKIYEKSKLKPELEKMIAELPEETKKELNLNEPFTKTMIINVCKTVASQVKQDKVKLKAVRDLARRYLNYIIHPAFNDSLTAKVNETFNVLSENVEKAMTILKIIVYNIEYPDGVYDASKRLDKNLYDLFNSKDNYEDIIVETEKDKRKYYEQEMAALMWEIILHTYKYEVNRENSTPMSPNV